MLRRGEGGDKEGEGGGIIPLPLIPPFKGGISLSSIPLLRS